MRIGSNWLWVSCTQFCSATSAVVNGGTLASPAACAAVASMASSSSAEVLPSMSAITRLWSHKALGKWPGSPNCGVSASVPASASSMDTDSAPASISASESASARAASACRVTAIHISVQPFTSLRLASLCSR